MLIKQTVESLGGKRILRAHPRTATELDACVRKGFPLSVLNFVATGTAITTDKFHVRAIVDRMVSRSTYKRRLKQQRLSMRESEAVLRLATLQATAKHVLGNDELARRFLNNPHPKLGGRKPIDIADTEIGGRQVEEILQRAFYGIPG
jgi:putative toxin-antitoxin system antitoxin component (TIGR02293 family)